LAEGSVPITAEPDVPAAANPWICLFPDRRAMPPPARFPGAQIVGRSAGADACAGHGAARSMTNRPTNSD